MNGSWDWGFSIYFLISVWKQGKVSYKKNLRFQSLKTKKKNNVMKIFCFALARRDTSQSYVVYFDSSQNKCSRRAKFLNLQKNVLTKSEILVFWRPFHEKRKLETVYFRKFREEGKSPFKSFTGHRRILYTRQRKMCVSVRHLYSNCCKVSNSWWNQNFPLWNCAVNLMQNNSLFHETFRCSVRSLFHETFRFACFATENAK